MEGIQDSMRTQHSTTARWMAALVLATSLAVGGAARAGGITGIVSFGDSLSDVGNDSLASNGAYPPASAYYNGRFSNGPIWLDYLAKDLGVAAPTPSLAGGANYAFGGAQTGAGYSDVPGFPVPNIDTQIGMYLHGNTPSATQLFTLWGGANDAIFGSSPNPLTSVSNILSEITTLADAGAKQFLIPNLPPLNSIPAVMGSPADQTALAQFTQIFNSQLAADLPGLQNTLGVHITLLDVNTLTNKVIANPSQYGFTNVTDSALFSGSNGSGYLFWDQYHPTTQAQQLIGSLAAQSVPEPSSIVLLAVGLGALTAGLKLRVRPR
jgi:phospholipase/lecithinase/hemolysin